MFPIGSIGIGYGSLGATGYCLFEDEPKASRDWLSKLHCTSSSIPPH